LSLERIYKALVSLGLSQTDARVYIHLATKGPAQARRIIDDLSVTKRQVYRSLNRLQDKSIIIANDKHPKEYSALPFETVLDMLINLKQEQAQDIKKRRKELLSSWRANEK
jgi:sugar-specific transcriptional regulator TrmB